MKANLLFLFAILGIFSFWNNNPIKGNAGTELTTPVANNKTSPNEIVGQWKKVAGGEDANKNRVLDEPEIIKNPEPGAQDNLHFSNDGKCRVFGMGMETAGTYRVKNISGKKMILINHNETPANLPEDKKDKDAMKFEIVSEEANKLVVIPPIYSFMLVVYERAK